MRDSILHRVADGEPAAIRELTDRYGGLVFALARRFSFDQSEVDDAVQEIFVALWKSAARFDPAIGSEDTFVAMVARRRLIDRRRRISRRIQAAPTDASASPPSARRTQPQGSNTPTGLETRASRPGLTSTSLG